MYIRLNYQNTMLTNLLNRTPTLCQALFFSYLCIVIRRKTRALVTTPKPLTVRATLTHIINHLKHTHNYGKK